ncbi:auxin-responsive protein IAA1-like isoform X2 [Humulus lupulus]|uniref:auxin-responsive protein IAA1-like isoform X2 n=1 Tax=Humulus lupulus TaxID=3486 RepID=UPI002B405181|nr:auxin-responsive protein IAA1-like isoform X2 [Humulus lupulus]
MMAFKDMTELTLGPPGGELLVAGSEVVAVAAAAAEATVKSGEFSYNKSSSSNKRGFVETQIEVLDQLSSTGEDAAAAPKNAHLNDMSFDADATSRIVREAPPAKAQAVIGWPPVRSFRKKAMESEKCSNNNNKFVKVAADGAPYLRKVDLENYNSYHHLLTALDDMFGTTNNNYCILTNNININIQGINSCGNIIVEDQRFNKLAKAVKGTTEYVPTYEDKDGDLMLVGDVPWKMFTESCKRIRLMKSSEAIGLARSKNES